MGTYGTLSAILCFSPQGRAPESTAPLQTAPHPGWSEDEGLCAHDPVPGVLGGSQALCTPAPQRQHDHGEWQDQHHGTPFPRPLPLVPASLLPSPPSPAPHTLMLDKSRFPKPVGITCQKYVLYGMKQAFHLWLLLPQAPYKQLSGHERSPTPHGEGFEPCVTTL